MLRDDAKPLTIGELNKKYKLPNLNQTFKLDKIKGLASKVEFDGSFTIKSLSLEEEAKYLAEVNGWVFSATNGVPEGISIAVYEYINAKTYLKYCIVDAPEWWWDFSENPMDINVLKAIHDKAISFKNELASDLLQDKPEAIEQKENGK